MTATIQVRTNPKTKKAAQQVLAKLGMDLSTAINIYLVQIVEKKGIPFQILTENGMTPEKERQILKEIDWALKHGKSFSSTKEMFDDILGK
jgi:DNA-damage-inducible protein J